MEWGRNEWGILVEAKLNPLYFSVEKRGCCDTLPNDIWQNDKIDSEQGDWRLEEWLSGEEQ